MRQVVTEPLTSTEGGPTLKIMRWGLLVVIAVAACGSGRTRTLTRSEGSSASAPTKQQHRPFRVLPYCEVSGRAGGMSVGNHPTDDVEVDVDVALEGVETVTSEPDAATRRAWGSAAATVGSKTPMRVLLNLKCSAQFPSGQPYNVALADRWFKRVGDEYRVDYCKATTLDLTSLDAGKPYSMLLHPIVLDDWKIQSLSPDLSSIEIGPLVDKSLGVIRITGAHRCAGPGSDGIPLCLPGQLDAGGAQVAWDYAVAGEWTSRVDLTADCPTLESEAKDASGSDIAF